jgi:hypothetical protein
MFCDGSFRALGCLVMGPLVMGHCVMDHFVMGRFVMGRFVCESKYLLFGMSVLILISVEDGDGRIDSVSHAYHGPETR